MDGRKSFLGFPEVRPIILTKLSNFMDKRLYRIIYGHTLNIKLIKEIIMNSKNIILGFTFLLMLFYEMIFCQNYETEKKKLITEAESIIDNFMSLVANTGIICDTVPSVEVKTTPLLIFYTSGKNTITLPFWPELNEDGKQMFTNLARHTKNHPDGELFFKELFNWFAIPHELAHHIQFELDLYKNLNHYESEIMANRFAVAFWLTQDDQEVRLEKLGQSFKEAYSSLPSPVPEGENPIEYFNTHYSELMRNPNAYGYYQLKFMSDAIIERKNLNLIILLKSIKPGYVR